MNTVDIKVVCLPNCFALPKYTTDGAAAMDLYAAQEVVLLPEALPIAVPTGIAIELPEGYEAQIRARSSMGAKGIIVTNAPGTIDSDYRGEIKVLLATLVLYRHTYSRKGDHQNFGPGDKFTLGRLGSYPGYIIKRGDRIAQMLIAPVTRGNIIQASELSATARGDGGFGSTGVNG